MKNWTESEAKRVLMSAGDVQNPSGKTITVRKGITGLKACSAMDYLQNHCGYNILV